MEQSVIYSIGHSNHTFEYFVSLLKKNDINCIVDVRSMPASKYNPQFNAHPLSINLKKCGVQYLPFGQHFGARRTDCINKDGYVDFEEAIFTDAFQIGVSRIKMGLEKGYKISFMCSEADPVMCHRFAMVSRYFHEHGFEVKHILKDGSLETHESVEKRMVDEYIRKKKLAQIDELFPDMYSKEDQLKDAYRIKNKEIGFHPVLHKVEELW